jgi:DNA-binding IclR family transcriptional regulator
VSASTATSANRKRPGDNDLAAVKTLHKALALLDAFAVAERPLTVAEAAGRANITRPTAHRLIQTLITAGYLAQNAADGRITPGYSALMLAGSILDASQLRLESLPHLASLARATGERAALGILHRDQMLYLAGVEKPSLPTIFSRFGKAVPAYCSALGKAILAYLPEEGLARYLDAVPLARRTELTITDEAALRAELAQVKHDGFAIDRGENARGTCCVAAPILVHGTPIAAIAVIGRALEPLMRHKEQVQHAAEVIAHVLSRGT